MVVRGARKPDPDLDSFDPVEQGAIPSLVIEVLSQTQRIRKKDQEDKVALERLRAEIRQLKMSGR
jgi:Uma2 family endonuclease